MEASIIIRGEAKSPEHLSAIKLMFSDDAPIFEEDMDKKWRIVFRALEDLFPPESVIEQGDLNLEFNWLFGYSFDDDMVESLNCLSNAGLTKLVAYYWADESEGVIALKDNLIFAVKNWRKKLADITKDTDNLEDDKKLSLLLETTMCEVF